MSKPPDDMFRLSEALSEVMDDIGVNKTLVMKRRRAWMVNEAIRKIYPGILGLLHFYNFGSQIEGSTTVGLESDLDVLVNELSSVNRINVIQTLSEWEDGSNNFMMIQNENITSGYFYLQLIKTDQPNIMLMVTDSQGRLLAKNSSMFLFVPDQSIKHGPAIIQSNRPGLGTADVVFGLYCKSLPHQATSWLQKQRECKWPTEDVLEECRNAGCFVVPVGSKVHSPDILESELEWRISTSLQERYIMFSLNITQLSCYILMKMILTTYINPHVEDVLSSFMCKNVLMYCIANSSHDWYTGNLLAYLHLSLFMLKECVQQRNCPHFMIPENNLLAGHMTEAQRGKLLDIIQNLMKNDKQLLFDIQIDNLGEKLKIKLNMIPIIPLTTNISQLLSLGLAYEIAGVQNEYLTMVLCKVKHESIKQAQQYLFETFSDLKKMIRRKDELLPFTDIDILHTACDLLIPLVSSAIGSVMASRDIDSRTVISNEAFTYLEAGKESDALSGRLKLASVLYCTGDTRRTKRELTITHTNLTEVITVCNCRLIGYTVIKYGSMSNFERNTEKLIKSNVALCTKFLQCEINCVPHELRYEILRSFSEEDRKIRTDKESVWMDLIAVDSISYLYYLQYKTYGHLRRRKEQQKALVNLERRVKLEPNQHHTETTFNLLGQCLEQENIQESVLECYIRSLHICKRNNAARFLLCLQLFKLWKRDNIQ